MGTCGRRVSKGILKWFARSMLDLSEGKNTQKAIDRLDMNARDGGRQQHNDPNVSFASG